MPFLGFWILLNTRDKHPCPSGIQTHYSTNQAAKTYALECAATRIGTLWNYWDKMSSSIIICFVCSGFSRWTGFRDVVLCNTAWNCVQCTVLQYSFHTWIPSITVVPSCLLKCNCNENELLCNSMTLQYTK
jgi:hypothetical protein